MQTLSYFALRRALKNFFRREYAGGVVLFVAALLALAMANSPFAAGYAALLDLPVAIRFGSFEIFKPLLLWINDGLMAVFFFQVGMELKREVIEGQLSSLRLAVLPAFAALGGMLVPALIYAAFNWGDRGAMSGWAIPTATDIAFALGVLSLLGSRVPAALKIFLLSIAIFDDLGAIVVIALFFTAELSTLSLVSGGIITFVLALLNRFGANKPFAYLLLGVLLWVAVLKSGVHATLAGVVLALFIPLREPAYGDGSLLKKLEHELHPWVTFGVLPLFAFANAGVPLGDLSLREIVHPVPLGIVSGLFFGKQIGIMACCWLATRLRIAALPTGVGWWPLYGTALLCGIGFTMSLFIASLAFEQGETAYLGLERLGILLGTLISGVCGFLVLKASLEK
jgi:Na+:H+ antiporter, NhaA family